MPIIREPDGSLSPSQIALLEEWHVQRCNVKDCREIPTTIVTGLVEVPTIGLCERHYQEANQTGPAKVRHEFHWDKFNAWEYAEGKKDNDH